MKKTPSLMQPIVATYPDPVGGRKRLCVARPWTDEDVAWVAREAARRKGVTLSDADIEAVTAMVRERAGAKL